MFVKDLVSAVPDLEQKPPARGAGGAKSWTNRFGADRESASDAGRSAAAAAGTAAEPIASWPRSCAACRGRRMRRLAFLAWRFPKPPSEKRLAAAGLCRMGSPPNIAVIGVVPVRVGPGVWSAGQYESKRGSPAVLELPGDRLQERTLDAEGSDDHDCVDCGAERHCIANHGEGRCIDQHHVERLTEVVEERRNAVARNKFPCSRRDGSTRQKMQDTFEIRMAVGSVGHLGSAVSLDFCL